MKDSQFLYHVHTRASHDSHLDVKSTIRHCVKHGIKVLAITDHDSFERYPEYHLLCENAGIRLIPGVEYTSDAGDIIGLFIDNFRPRRDVNDILRDIREQGGISVIPHPYHGHDLELIDFDLIDGIEVFNARCSEPMNALGLALAEKHGKVQFAAGDVHMCSELGLVRMQFADALDHLASDEDLKQRLLFASRTFVTGATPKTNIYLSQVIKGLKIGNPRIVARNLAKYVLHPLREVYAGRRAGAPR